LTNKTKKKFFKEKNKSERENLFIFSFWEGKEEQRGGERERQKGKERN